MGIGQVRRSCFSERSCNYDACRDSATIAFRETSIADGKVKQSRSQDYTAHNEDRLWLCEDQRVLDPANR